MSTDPEGVTKWAKELAAFSGGDGREATRKANLWDKMRLLLGVPAAVFSAAAGATALADVSGLIPAMCGFAATILAALQTFLPSERRARQYELIAIDFYELANEANILADFGHDEPTEVRVQRLDDLQKKFHALQRQLISSQEHKTPQ
jgi:hypothetical protein